MPVREGREVKGLPGKRGFGKSVSAPVGGMSWGRGMEVDKVEDGFDVREWAASEEF